MSDSKPKPKKKIKFITPKPLNERIEEIDGITYIIRECPVCKREFAHELGKRGRVPIYDTDYCQQKAHRIREEEKKANKH